MDWGSPRPSGSMICLEDSAYNPAHGFDLLQQRIQSKISKQNGAGGEVQEKSDTSFPGSSPSRVAEDVLNSQSKECDNTGEMLLT